MGRFGVPGIGGNVWGALREGDISESALDASEKLHVCGGFADEERRRRCEKDPPGKEEEDAEVGVRDARLS